MIKKLTCEPSRSEQNPFKGVVHLAGLFCRQPSPNLLRDSFRIRVRPLSEREGKRRKWSPNARVCQQPLLSSPSNISIVCLPLTQFRPTRDRSVIFRPSLPFLFEVSTPGEKQYCFKWAFYIVVQCNDSMPDISMKLFLQSHSENFGLELLPPLLYLSPCSNLRPP